MHDDDFFCNLKLRKLKYYLNYMVSCKSLLKNILLTPIMCMCFKTRALPNEICLTLNRFQMPFSFQHISSTYHQHPYIRHQKTGICFLASYLIIFGVKKLFQRNYNQISTEFLKEK